MKLILDKATDDINLIIADKLKNLHDTEKQQNRDITAYFKNSEYKCKKYKSVKTLQTELE